MSMIGRAVGFMGGGSVALSHLVTTWDPAKKDADIVLSGSDLIATTSGGAGAVLTLDAATAYCYVDVTITDKTDRSFVAIANSSANLAGALGNDANAWSYVDTGNKRTNNVDVAYGATWTAGDVIRAEINSGSLTFYKNGASQGVAYTGLTGTLYFGYSNNGTGSATLG